MGLAGFMLLTVYRIVNHTLLQFDVNTIWGVELAVISNYLNQSLIVEYAMKVGDYLVDLSYIVKLKVSLLYFKTFISEMF